MKLNKHIIISEYLVGGISVRALAKKYGVSHSTIYDWIKELPGARRRPARLRAEDIPASAKEAELAEELRKAKLHNKLLEAMLQIGKEQYGIDLRKKPGTRQ
ncbi:MAG TPA: transposase [Bacteroidia bacterium]|jgi:transposase|nr:transposase [Bacteroidia bacterium]